ncbi:MAG: CehA/McbA family metallohydrolase [Chloroflexota bacterium]
MQHQFTGTLTASDMKKHIQHTFDMPAQAAQISILLTATEGAVDGLSTMLTLTIFDSQGFRGAGHRGGQKHAVTIGPEKTTPGYRKGSLPMGTWIVQIDTHRILADRPCDYQLDIDITLGSPLDSFDEPTQKTPDFSPIANPSPGWYRGDLHSHTIHSDASWDVPDLVAAAHAYHLDFIALTDHNTISGLAEMASFSGPELLTMGGQELTTFWGHAVCLGQHDWLDWRVTQTGPEIAAIAEQLETQGYPFIIAHPKDIGDPKCTGCRWLYPEMMPGSARFVEIWNESWYGHNPTSRAKNEDGLALWYQWLNDGHRLVATAGSDTHGPQGYAQNPGFNIVYANTLSEADILAALWQGHLYLSAGPTLTFTAQTTDGVQPMMGDTLLMTDEKQTATFTVTWEACPDEAVLSFIVDGKPKEAIPIIEQGSQSWSLSSAQGSWCLVEIRDYENAMLAITNPIFFGI